MGRGDSALHSLGRPPALVADLETFLADVAAYLAGAAPALDPVAWIGRVPRVPLDVAATGPKVIAAAARHADQITFAAGADADRLKRSIDLARHRAAAAGRDPDRLTFGGSVNAAAHPDAGVARRVVQGRASTFARFSAHGGRRSPTSPAPIGRHWSNWPATTPSPATATPERLRPRASTPGCWPGSRSSALPAPAPSGWGR